MNNGPTPLEDIVHLYDQMSSFYDVAAKLRNASDPKDRQWAWDETCSVIERTKLVLMRLHNVHRYYQEQFTEPQPPQTPSRKKKRAKKDAVVIPFKRPEPGPYVGDPT